MALADIPAGGQPRRLDSWKEIAEYLRRDVRTATRWEAQGLPLHRVAGGKGRSVFAFTNEIDEWMASHPAEPQADVAVIQPPATPATSPRRLRTVAISAACAIVVIGIGAVAMSTGAGTPILLRPEITVNENYVSITDASGAPRVIHQFKHRAVLGQPRQVARSDVNAAGVGEILTAVAAYIPKDASSHAPGELLNLTTDGLVRWRFGFDDALTFAGRTVSGPWIVTDWGVEPDTSAKRIAIAAREETWWASLVTVLDHTGRRQGAAFVNPGWIESVLWQPPDRLAIAGFNNDRRSAMFAMLDANNLGGQAPGIAAKEFWCVTCSLAAPIFYATLPRSELNLVASEGFIRAYLVTAGDRLVVYTTEVARSPFDVVGIYEFDRDLRFLTARYSDSYWREHARVEREGRLSHSRDQCPERDGPAAIHVWDAARGWVRTTPSAASRP